MKNRVVITGMGAITPIGKDVETFWSNAKNGVCGVDHISSFDTTDFKVKVAAEIKDFNPKDYMERKEAKRMDRFCQFAIAASKMAMDDSGIDLNNINNEKFGVIIGSGIGGMDTFEKEVKKLYEKGPDKISPFFIPMMISNMASGLVAIKYEAKGANMAVVTACATGSNAIGEAYRKIQNKECDVIIAGGTEATITPMSMAGFAAMTAVSVSSDPKRASIPFDNARDGFVMGEGSGILILEDYEHAVKRNAKIYAEVVGYGSTCDAYHITQPEPSGSGASKSMKMAIDDAGITPDKIDYINAHGTSTPYNDKFETAAIKSVLGDHAYKTTVSSTKSMTGHLLGAAGAVEAIICVKSLNDNYVPPTIGYQVPDPDCDLDYVTNEGREKDVTYTLSNSLGFGGHNATIILKKFEE